MSRLEVSDQERKRARHVRGILSALGLCPTGDIGGPEYEQMEANRRADLHVTVERLDRFDVFTLWNAIRGLADAPEDEWHAVAREWGAAFDAHDWEREADLWAKMRGGKAERDGAVKAALEGLAGPDGLVDELTAALEADPASFLDLGELDNVAAELAAA